VLTPLTSPGALSPVHSHAIYFSLYIHTAREIFIRGPPPSSSEIIESVRVAPAAVPLAAAASPRADVPKSPKSVAGCVARV